MTSFLRFSLGRLLLRFTPTGRCPKANRVWFRLMGAQIGHQVTIYSNVTLARGMRVSVGHSTFVGERVTVTGGKGSSVSIGANCDISDHVHFVTGSHRIDGVGPRAAGKGFSRNITISDGVWIGYRALILPGVTVGEKAVVGAGTLVNRDVVSRTVVAGNPMRVVGEV